MEMKVSYAVKHIVEAMLPRFSDEHLGLWIGIDARLSFFNTANGDQETRHSAEIQLLFHRPSNYTKVFWYTIIDNFLFLSKVPEDQWELKCDHDDCWTSDGLESPLNRVWWTLRAMFPKEMPYEDLSPLVSFGIGCPELVRVDVTPRNNTEFPRQYTVRVHETIDRHDLISELLKQRSILPLLINLPGWGPLVKEKLRDPS